MWLQMGKFNWSLYIIICWGGGVFYSSLNRSEPTFIYLLISQNNNKGNSSAVLEVIAFKYNNVTNSILF